MTWIPIFSVLLFLVSFVFAVDLRGRVQWNDICPNYTALGSAEVVLDDGSQSGGVMRNGSFTIYGVEPGTYVLSVQAHDYIFDKMRIDVPKSKGLPEIKSYILGTPLLSENAVTLPYPISLLPRRKNSYFVPPQSFNLMGMFQNPMMIVMVLTGVLVLGMPYLMKNLDPQSLEEIKEQQSKIAQIQSGGLSALFTPDEPKGSTSARPQTSSSTVQQRNRGKSNKKR